MSELLVSEKGLRISEDKPRGNCWLFHAWSRWETTDEGNLKHVANNAVIGKFIVQRRECLRCGKIELASQEVF